jgi:hypothetical protein
MNLIDTQRAGESIQNFGSEVCSVILLDRKLQAIVNEARRQFQKEVPFHRLLDGGGVELIDQDAIKYCFSNAIVVLGFRLNILGMSTEGFTTSTFSDVLAVMHLSPKLLAKCKRTYQSHSNSLTSSQLATSRTRSLSWMTRIDYRLCGCFLASMPGSFF